MRKTRGVTLSPTPGFATRGSEDTVKPELLVNTHSYGVGPTDLCLKFCKTYQQHHIVLPIVAHLPRTPELWRGRCCRNISKYMAQGFEPVFWIVSAGHRDHITKSKIVPRSTSIHCGFFSRPSYLMIRAYALFCGAPSRVTRTVLRISRVSRTLVP